MFELFLETHSPLASLRVLPPEPSIFTLSAGIIVGEDFFSLGIGGLGSSLTGSLSSKYCSCPSLSAAFLLTGAVSFFFFPNKNLNVFEKNYSELDRYTQNACFEGGTVKGIVGFASPARLFYSDFISDKTSINNLSRLMAKSIIENDVFYLTVNYSNDPFGFSNSENFTLKKLQESMPNISSEFKNTKGFIYNKSDNYVPRTFITAHLAYWQTPKRFAKAIVKAFKEGYPHFYALNEN